MKNALIKTVTPSVHMVDGIATVSSLDVARHFGKRHDNVLQAIQDLCAQLPPDYLLNFQEVMRTYPSGKGGRQTAPTFNLTRDGFTLLAMGFTGPKALAFKLAYIDAFNRMADQLNRMYAAPLTGDREFRKGIKLSDRLKLQEMGQKIARQLDKASGSAERYTLFWQLRQVNEALGIPTPSLEALGIALELPAPKDPQP